MLLVVSKKFINVDNVYKLQTFLSENAKILFFQKALRTKEELEGRLTSLTENKDEEEEDVQHQAVNVAAAPFKRNSLK